MKLSKKFKENLKKRVQTALVALSLLLFSGGIYFLESREGNLISSLRATISNFVGSVSAVSDLEPTAKIVGGNFFASNYLEESKLTSPSGKYMIEYDSIDEDNIYHVHYICQSLYM